MTDQIRWVKSSHSIVGGEIHECVEVARGPVGVLVRDSKDPDGVRLGVPMDAWQVFVESIVPTTKGALGNAEV